MSPRTPRSGLATIPAGMLQAELNRRRSGLKRLEKKHATLLKKLRDLEAEMQRYGGRDGSGRERPRNRQSLVDALAQVLKGKTMGVPDAADAVLATGYRSNAGNFRLIVNQALIKNSDRFKKVSRGHYTAK